MKRHAFLRNARQTLRPILGCSGKVLYSSADTLKPGDIYILGLNPGGRPEEHRASIEEMLSRLSRKIRNDYVDEGWGNRKPGDHPLQRRLSWLMSKLGYDLKEVAASNLIFLRTKNAAGLKMFYKYADMCWPVHESILEIIRPKVLIVFGSSGVSPYSYLRLKFGVAAREDKHWSGHGDWFCRAFEANFERFTSKVVGLPHLSRYNVIGKNQVVDWIRRYLRG